MHGSDEQTAALLPAARDPYAAFRSRAYRLYLIGNFIAVLGRQMLTVAVLTGQHDIVDVVHASPHSSYPEAIKISSAVNRSSA